MLVPLYGFLRGDTLGLVILVYQHQTIRDVAATLQQAACMRVAPGPNAQVFFQGKILDLELTVAEVGLTALDRVDVTQEQ